ncbi:unnamed protein product [Acanthoscelides obtectus]|uniref:GDNF/GAS1 domain-containing protein n=1 Tax=Acanthoscelides obtectus TaxID=200917 RepID=A0A9P0NUP4_ACAOB|nr:unnamed protein product [Acanthoscelides obtectus]CAK1661360.1 GDNF family receptor alpha-like [Acanthoscelides obtectus]
MENIDNTRDIKMVTRCGTASTDSTSTTIRTSTGTTASVEDHVEDADDDWLEELLAGAADWPTKDGARLPASSESNVSTTTFDVDLGVSDALENPLVDAANGLEAHKGLDHISVTVLKNKDKPQLGTRWYPEDTDGGALDSTVAGGAGSWTHHRHGQSPAEGNEIQERQPIFHSTCHTAMASCQAHHKCRALMSPVLHYCDQQRCNRNACMSALQAFYSKQDLIWNMEVAFCLCKKTDNKQDACLIAQEKLHPVCAQRTEDTPQPTCLHLAENCRENKDCRLKLEHYEQSCAVDSVTKKCAGSPSECRNAILGILGTDLRTTCACKGTDMTQLYECLGWQRLLWVNPCVVEAQKNFHVSKTGYYKPTTTTTTDHPRHTTEAPRPTPFHFVTVMAITEASLQTKINNFNNQVHPIVEFIPPPQAFVPTSTTTTTIASTTTTVATTTTKRTRPTTTATTTIVPPRSCVVQRPQFPDQHIREGSFKRIYHEDEFECSDICECEVGEKLTCRTICIDRMPCKTEFAYYNHAAPAYQAYRGRCLCYSGRFICMKPMPNDYNLPQGIYLFLGYSEVDERELNRNHTVVIVQDVVRVLQNILEDEAVNGDECMELLEIISEKINSRNPDFISHLLLSIFKMAEVEIVQPEPASAASGQLSNIFLIVTMAVLTVLNRLNTNFCIS